MARGRIITMPTTNKSSSIQSRVRRLRRATTEAESLLWSRLRAHRLAGVHFRRQHPIGPYIVDFCATDVKLIVEVDGGGHIDQAKYDMERSAYLGASGYRVLRFWNDEIMKDMDTVLGVILEALERPSQG